MAAAPSAPVPRWQTALAALSLALLSVVVILPIAAFLLLVWALIVAVASGWTLQAIGVDQSYLVQDAVVLAIALLGATGLVALVSAVVSRLPPPRPRVPPPYSPYPGFPRPPPGYPAPPPTTPTRTSLARWSFRHPWLALGAFTFLVDGSLVPLQASHAIAVPKVLLGGTVLASAFLVFLFAVVGLLKAYAFGLRTIWSSVRRSSYFAGMVTAGSVIVTLLALLVGSALGSAASALSPRETARALEECSGSVTDCTRQIAYRAGAGSGSRNLRPAEGLPLPESPTSFERCIEELHRPDLYSQYNQSARDQAFAWALKMTRNTADAEDLVHGALLSVCLGSEGISDIRPYFFRSVQNAVSREGRRSRRYCSLVPDEFGYIQMEMEASAHDALCHLDGDERRLVEMHLWDNLSHADIAHRLRVSEPAARQRYSRALRSLRDEFAKRCR
jgi:RNA polymerase sigma factor (sigma-70 family)